MHRRTASSWLIVSLLANAILAGWVMLLYAFPERRSVSSLPSSHLQSIALATAQGGGAPGSLDGPRHQLTYEDWVRLLDQEASAIARQVPDQLAILVGDSLSLWFPPELLPQEYIWLNQGISGETTAGLRDRLDLLDQLQPEYILVMIGINDLLQGISTETVLANQREIIRYLRQTHPESEIVLQSLLPHGAEAATWEGRQRLEQIPNQELQQLNAAMAAMAASEQVAFLDLQPLFRNQAGQLRPELTTDGLHLNPAGYHVWSTALRLLDPG